MGRPARLWSAWIRPARTRLRRSSSRWNVLWPAASSRLLPTSRPSRRWRRCGDGHLCRSHGCASLLLLSGYFVLSEETIDGEVNVEAEPNLVASEGRRRALCDYLAFVEDLRLVQCPAGFRGVRQSASDCVNNTVAKLMVAETLHSLQKTDKQSEQAENVNFPIIRQPPTVLCSSS